MLPNEYGPQATDAPSLARAEAPGDDPQVDQAIFQPDPDQRHVEEDSYGLPVRQVFTRPTS
jgi:hypothetical protein